uniref:Putative cytochrome P450 n=1 Tax=Tanacetum cinerariifolium TaxID=118510 RepID=A0A6L2KXK1_TANCI|nr:putative cytochrome P450 [Tanacetum cinerariifolium]
MLDMISNGVFRAELEVESILHKTREGRLRWFGHVKRTPQTAPVRRVKTLFVDGLRRRGRPKRRWEDELKQDMKELLLSEDMTSDRNAWRDRINIGPFRLWPFFVCAALAPLVYALSLLVLLVLDFCLFCFAFCSCLCYYVVLLLCLSFAISLYFRVYPRVGVGSVYILPPSYPALAGLDMISNGVFRAELEVESILHKTREGRLRWFGHVKRTPQTAPVRRVKALFVDGLRRRGRPKLRCEDELKQDMKELLLSEDMTSNRNAWRARINICPFRLWPFFVYAALAPLVYALFLLVLLVLDFCFVLVFLCIVLLFVLLCGFASLSFLCHYSSAHQVGKASNLPEKNMLKNVNIKLSLFSLCYLLRKSFSSTTMRDANPIRTLGDYSRPSYEGYRNTIELLEGNNVVLLRYDTIRAPEKVLMREEAKHHVTKNVNSICLIRGEEEKNDDDNATTGDSIKEPDGSNAEMLLKESKKENEAENWTKNESIRSAEKELTQAEKEEAVEAPGSQPVGVRKMKWKTYNLLPRGDVYEAIPKKNITKKEDIRENFDIPCNIGGLKHMNALVDQGSDVNIMPLSTYRNLIDERPAETDIRLSLTSYSYIYPLGIANDVLVNVVGHVYPVYFVNLDIKEDEKRPFILGTPFLTTDKAVIKFDKGTVTLRSGNSKISFHKILESLYKIEKGIKNDIEPIAPTMTVNRLILE